MHFKLALAVFLLTVISTVLAAPLVPVAEFGDDDTFSSDVTDAVQELSLDENQLENDHSQDDIDQPESDQEDSLVHTVQAVALSKSGVSVGDAQLQQTKADFVLANSDPAQYTFSDVHSSCSNIASIDSADGWCTAGGASGFMVIDLKRMMNIAGIQTQGRGTHAQWVSSYDVSVSSDGITWKNLGVKTGNTDQSSKVNNLFQERARYVKIAVVRMNSHASMRGDVLLSKTQDPLPLVTLANSDPAQYSFSDVHSSCSNVAQIDSSDGWCTAGGSSGFMVIDLKRVMNVEGIQTQGRGTHAQWVSAADISFSTDGQRWENHGRFPLNSDQSTKVNTYVSGKARYVKIAVVKMNSHASMRGDVLLSKVQAALPPVALAYSSPAQYSFSDVHSSCSNVPQIDSSDGWCTAGGSSGFMVIDLKRVMNVEGIQTQGRGTSAQWVKSADISFSTDGQRWENQGVYPLNSDQSTKVNTYVSGKARYVKIAVVKMNSHASMRGDVLLSPNQDGLPAVQVWTPPASAFRFSDVHSSCTNAAGAMINGNGGWCTAGGGRGWMIIDAGAERPVAGVATQGRSDSDQWVTQFSIATSNDGNAWADAGSFPGNSDRTTVVQTFIFPTVNARYVRISIEKLHGHSSMRAGILIQTAPAPAARGSKSLSPSDLSALRSDTSSYTGKHNEHVNGVLNMLDHLLAKITAESLANQVRVAEAVDSKSALEKATREIAMIKAIKQSIHCMNGQASSCT